MTNDLIGTDLGDPVAKLQLTKELDNLQLKALTGDSRAAMLLAVCMLEFEITPDESCINHLIELNNRAGDPAECLELLIVDESWLSLLASVLLENRYLTPTTNREVVEMKSGRVVSSRTNDLLWLVINFTSWDYCFKNEIPLDGTEFFEKGKVDLKTALEVFKSTLHELNLQQSANALNSLEKTKNGLREIAGRYTEAMYLMDLMGDATDTWLKKSSDAGFMLASYKLAISKADTDLSGAEELLDRLDSSIEDSDNTPPAVLERLRKNGTSQLFKSKIALAVSKARAETMEDMMAMFAHQFRGAVGSIRFNAEHQNDASIYIKLAQSMSGLLETFGIVSTTPERLADSFKYDDKGENLVASVLHQTIELVLAELLSKSSRTKISPYYRVYAQHKELAPQEISQSEWSSTTVWTKLESELQAQWESEISALMGSQDGAQVRQWFAEHFLPIQLIGIEASSFRFAEYGPKASLFTIVFAEMIANAIKYSVTNTKEALTIIWASDNSNVTFTCTNPSTFATRQRAQSKGSGRGHKFLALIADHLGGKFISNVKQEISSCSFSFPIGLMGGNDE